MSQKGAPCFPGGRPHCGSIGHCSNTSASLWLKVPNPAFSLLQLLTQKQQSSLAVGCFPALCAKHLAFPKCVRAWFGFSNFRTVFWSEHPAHNFEADILVFWTPSVPGVPDQYHNYCVCWRYGVWWDAGQSLFLFVLAVCHYMSAVHFHALKCVLLTTGTQLLASF